MNNTMIMLLCGGFSMMVLISIFRPFFNKVFRFISAGLVIALVISFVCGFFNLISHHQMVNATLIFGVALRYVNKLF